MQVNRNRIKNHNSCTYSKQSQRSECGSRRWPKEDILWLRNDECFRFAVLDTWSRNSILSLVRNPLQPQEKKNVWRLPALVGGPLYCENWTISDRLGQVRLPNRQMQAAMEDAEQAVWHCTCIRRSTPNERKLPNKAVWAKKKLLYDFHNFPPSAVSIGVRHACLENEKLSGLAVLQKNRALTVPFIWCFF